MLDRPRGSGRNVDGIEDFGAELVDHEGRDKDPCAAEGAERQMVSQRLSPKIKRFAYAAGRYVLT